MAEAYWTHCMFCGEMICGVEILDDYPDVVVLYAHKDCYERHTDGRPITPVSTREPASDVPADLPRDAGPGSSDTIRSAPAPEFC
jgi:hypothetical protein